MAELDQVVGATKIELNIGGKTYTASPLTIGDFGEFRSWVKREKLSLFLKASKDAGLDSKERSEQIDRIMNLRPQVEDGDVTDIVLEEMGTEQGMMYILYLAIRKNHPEVKPEDLDVSLGELASLVDVIGQITSSGLNLEGNQNRPTEKAER